jgi:hypothetical protein
MHRHSFVPFPNSYILYCSECAYVNTPPKPILNNEPLCTPNEYPLWLNEELNEKLNSEDIPHPLEQELTETLSDLYSSDQKIPNNIPDDFDSEDIGRGYDL